VLCEAALGLFLGAGVEAVTIDEITQAAGVAKGTFYRYFEDKSQLVEALFVPVAEAFRAATDRASSALAEAKTRGKLEDAYRALAVDLASTLLPQARLVQLYLQESRAPAVGARTPIRQLADDVAARAIALTRVARERGLLRDLPPHVTALAVVGAVETLLHQYVQGRETGDPAATSEALVSMILHGVQARPRRHR
jgi:AcrR family transcriptional regulator